MNIQAFFAFRNENPHVERELVRLAREWQHARPGEQVGISMLWERMRWEIAVHTTGDSWRLNNDWRAFYARLLERDYPEFRGLFETRRSAADEAFAFDGRLFAEEQLAA